MINPFPPGPSPGLIDIPPPGEVDDAENDPLLDIASAGIVK